MIMDNKNSDTGDENRTASLLRVFGWLPLAVLVGLMAGVASAIFLIGLEAITAYRLEHPYLILGLPLAGLAVGWAYHRYGGDARQGTALIIDEIHVNSRQVPLRMVPFVLVGTWVSHLFGASVGREGTAIQMSASMADQLAYRLRLSPARRRLVLMTGIAAGFASVFGTPVAGVVFALEVQTVGAPRYEGLLAAVVAALVGDGITRGLGVHHSIYPLLPVMPLDAVTVLKVALAALGFGLTARLFIVLTDRIRELLQHRIAWPPLRVLIGGLVMVGFTLLLTTDIYNGLSLGLAKATVNGEALPPLAFLLKIAATAISLGSGFIGGEVTPLFVMGATTGAALEPLLQMTPGVLASLGFVAVFGAASNTPLACMLMGVELFGSGALPYLLLACVIAYLVSGQHTIYATQRIGVSKW